MNWSFVAFQTDIVFEFSQTPDTHPIVVVSGDERSVIRSERKHIGGWAFVKPIGIRLAAADIPKLDARFLEFLLPSSRSCCSGSAGDRNDLAVGADCDGVHAAVK